MTTAEIIGILVPVTLIEMMFAIGLSVKLAELATVAADWRWVSKAALANYLCVPLITVGLLVLFQPADPLVAAGFLILAVCPGAPFGPGCTKIAKGNVAAAVGLMVILAGSSAFAAPLLLAALLPLMSGNDVMRVDAVKIVITLLVTQLIPLAAGLVIASRWPAFAVRLRKPAGRLSAILNLTLFTLILIVYSALLADIRLRAYLGMLALLVASWLAGWLLGGPARANRKSMTLTTSLRNVGVGLVIATGNFGGTAAVTAVVTYGIVEIVGSLLLAIAWGHKRQPYSDSVLDSNVKISG